MVLMQQPRDAPTHHRPPHLVSVALDLGGLRLLPHSLLREPSRRCSSHWVCLHLFTILTEFRSSEKTYSLFQTNSVVNLKTVLPAPAREALWAGPSPHAPDAAGSTPVQDTFKLRAWPPARVGIEATDRCFSLSLSVSPSSSLSKSNEKVSSGKDKKFFLTLVRVFVLRVLFD